VVLEISTDGGNRWTSTTLPVNSDSQRSSLISCPAAGDCLVVSRSIEGPTSAWIRSSSGKWARAIVGTHSFTAQGVACPTKSTCLIVGNEGSDPSDNSTYGIFRSGDAGHSWQRVKLPSTLSVDIGELSTISCGGPLTCTATGVGTIYTRDGGITWSGNYFSGETEPFALSCPTQNACVGVNQASVAGEDATPLVAYVSSTQGDMWRRIVIPGSAANAGVPDVSCSSADDCVVVFSDVDASASYTTIDGGIRWQIQVMPESFSNWFSVSCAPASASCIAAGQLNDSYDLLHLSFGS